MAISTVSIGNTPQANSDVYTKSEDNLGVYCLDVMANDQGGNAKTLWSLDDTAADGYLDLISSDIGAASEFSLNGAKIWIDNGKVRYDTSTLNSSFATTLAGLAAGETLTDSFTYAIRLGNGTLAWTTAYVVYQGSNDSVVVTSAPHTGSLTEDAAASIGGSIAFTDPDASDTHTAAVTGTPANTLGTFQLGSVSEAANAANGTVGWTYTVNNLAAQYLAVGESVVETYTVTVTDNHGASTTTSVSVTINGLNDGVSIAPGGAVAGDVTEDVIPTRATGSFAFTDVDGSDTHSVTVAANGSGYLGTLNALVSDDSTGDGSGTVNWRFNVDNGAIQYLGVGDSLVQSYAITVDDGHGGSTTQTVSITINGANDGPVISVGSGDADGASLTETNSVLTASDTLTVVDPDTSDNVVVDVTGLVATGNTGTLTNAALEAMLTLSSATVAADSGSANNLGWSFNSGAANAFDYLAAGESLVLTYTVQGTDDEGATDTQTVTIRIVGTNDAAVITGTVAGSVIEATPSNAGTPQASATLTSNDVDNSNQFTPSAGNSSYGSFTMTAGGLWTYTLDNLNTTVNNLATGATLTDTFSITSVDGTSQTITVTINGRTDVVAVSAPSEFTGTGDINDNDGAGPAAGATVTSTGNGANTTWNGTNNNDTIQGAGGNDIVYGHLGNDTINGDQSNDNSLYGQQGDDNVYGGAGSDQIFGGTGNDTILGFEPPAGADGGDNGDTLYGGSGRDTIYGQGGNDVIIGGFGADQLYGGGGADTFRFIDVRDTNDTIHDFLLGTDLLDFAGVDANSATPATDQAFVWGGNTATANGLWFVQNGTTAVIYGDTDGNTATAEFMVTLENVNLTPHSASGPGGLPAGWVL